MVISTFLTLNISGAFDLLKYFLVTSAIANTYWKKRKDNVCAFRC